jgi:hypothetical protein
VHSRIKIREWKVGRKEEGKKERKKERKKDTKRNTFL